jgi:hypothetical protein
MLMGRGGGGGEKEWDSKTFKKIGTKNPLNISIELFQKSFKYYIIYSYTNVYINTHLHICNEYIL